MNGSSSPAVVGTIPTFFTEDATSHAFAADATLHLLDTVSWNQSEQGVIEIKYFIIWKSGNSTQGLNLTVQLDGVNTPLATVIYAQISSDVNDNVTAMGSFFVNIAPGNHSVTLTVAAANTLAAYHVVYSQIGVR